MTKVLQEIQEYVREKCNLRCDYFEYCCEDDGGDHCRKCGITKEEHYGLTLSRVLLALSKQDWWRFGYPLVMGFDGAFCEVWHSDSGANFSEKFHWDLTKETFEEQPEKTQIAINNLLRV